MLLWREVSWIPLAPSPIIWLEQHFHVKETFDADSDDVSDWELVDKIDSPLQIESEQPP